MGTSVQFDVVVALEPAAAFEAVTQSLADAPQLTGVELDTERGRIVDGSGAEIGRIVSWEPGEGATLVLRGEPSTDREMVLELETKPAADGTRITVTVRGLADALGGDPEDPAAWLGSELIAPLVRATTAERLGDWVTDRRVRRPSGAASRENYHDPAYHWPNFDAVLTELGLDASDRLLEVGCGGGAFLSAALRSGCTAAAVDHSPDMVRLARRINAEAIAAGRLEIMRADAAALPFAHGGFTAAAMTGVLAFLPDQAAALAEIHRVLAPGGRLVVFTGSPAMAGTPAAPEPYASRLRFLEDDELESLARTAGFTAAQVTRPDLRPLAAGRGIEGDVLMIFAPEMGQILVAGK
jgi:SAM-dependent methyltransferase